MTRRLLWSMLVALLVGGAAGGAAPPPAAKVRLLSLREAYALALEHAGREAGVVDPDADDLEPRAADAMRRCCLRGKLTHEQRRVLHQQLLNVEVAYWNLTGAYWRLYSRDCGCRLTDESLALVAGRFLFGQGRAAEFAQALGQHARFLVQRRSALDEIRSNEQQLRQLLGLGKDGLSLLPADAPELILRELDWRSALEQALTYRPEIALAREKVEVSKNQGRQALALALEHLRDTELKTQRFLGRQYELVALTQEQIQAARAQRLGFDEWLLARLQAFIAGRDSLGGLLEAQSYWVDALDEEFRHIIAYNNALAGFDFARGLSLHRAHLVGSKVLLSADKERKRAEARYRAPQQLVLRPDPGLASLWQRRVVPSED